MNEEIRHDIITTRKGIWICACGLKGDDRTSRNVHEQQIKASLEIIKQGTHENVPQFC